MNAFGIFVWIFYALSKTGALKTKVGSSRDSPSFFDALHASGVSHASRSSLYSGITNAFDKRSTQELRSEAKHERSQKDTPLPLMMESAGGDNFIQTSCVSLHFTKWAVIRIHVYDCCLYIRQDLKNFWGKNVTLPQLQKRLPGNAYFLTFIDTVHVDKALMEATLQKNLRILTQTGSLNDKRAEFLVDSYREMWVRSPELTRGSIVRQDILRNGMNVTIDGMALGHAPGPGVELMVFDPKLNGTEETPGLEANRINVLKSILRGNNITNETTKPEPLIIYTHGATL